MTRPPRLSAAARLLAAVAILGGMSVPAKAAEWTRFAVAEEGFSVEFPSEPAQDEVPVAPDSGLVLLHNYRAVSEGGNGFMVTAIRFVDEARERVGDEEMLGFAAAMFEAECTIGVSGAVEIAGAVAREVLFGCPEDVVMRVRFALSGLWLYQFVAVGDAAFVVGDDALRFLQSARLE